MDKPHRGVKAKYIDFININLTSKDYSLFIRRHSNPVSRSNKNKGLGYQPNPFSFVMGTTMGTFQHIDLKRTKMRLK